MLPEIAGAIETVRLQIGFSVRDVGQGGFRQDLGGDVVDAGVGYFVNEADIAVFAGGDARDDFAPGDLRIDDGFAAAPAIIDHHDKILHARACLRLQLTVANISENQKKVKAIIRKIRN